MSLEELQARIRVLEDIEEVKRLMATYIYVVDDSQWDDVADLFADNARAEYGMLGTYDGKEAIATFFKEVVSQAWSWAVHQLLNPLVTVEGEKATGRWYIFCSSTMPSPEGDRAMWVQASYDNEFVKINGRWKFSLLRLVFNFITPYDEGWVKSGMMTG